MLFYTVGQSYAFLAMLVCGLVLGAWYDLSRRLRNLLEAGFWLTAFMDAVFVFGALVIVVFSLLFTNRLELRLYALVGAGAGMALYLWGIAPIFGRFLLFFRRIFQWLHQNRKMKK